MEEYMVTHGRGLDNFVWQEILQKVPNANNLRHLGEGKIAFRAVKTGPQKQENGSEESCADKGILHEEKNVKVEEEETYDGLKVVDTKDSLREQNTTAKGIMTPLETSAEEENQWVAAVSYIFKLKLVERVFTLLHCEDIDAKAAHQDNGGKSNMDDILRDYENKLTSVVESIKWDNLAVRVRRVREHQAGERQVWCQDPDSCPGSLRKRQVRKELGEKRMVSTSLRGEVGSFSKQHRTDTMKRKHLQKNETNGQGSKRRKFIDDCELKYSVESYNMCEHENSKKQMIPESNIEETNSISVKRECEFENGFSNKGQNMPNFHIDVKAKVTTTCDHVTDVSNDSPSAVISCEYCTSQLDEVHVSQRETDSSENEVVPPLETKGATKNVNNISENYKALQNECLVKNNCPEHRSEEVKKENSNEHISTFRVSSRVSGPHKNIISVKWVNHALGQQLNKAMTAWMPDWRRPLVDLYVNITASHFVVGATLSPRPLSLRPYIPHLTLRSTISHLMARLSQMPPKATVLDPMCGGGSILLETAMTFDVSHVIASDSSRDQLEVARCNLHNLQIPVTLLEADAERLPLHESSINTVLCDFPFGQKYKLSVEGKHLLAGVLMEIQRLLMCEGRAVFLLSPRQHEALSQLTRDKTKPSTSTYPAGDCLTLLETHLVSLGETSAYVAVMVKEHSSSEVLKKKK